MHARHFKHLHKTVPNFYGSMSATSVLLRGLPYIIQVTINIPKREFFNYLILKAPYSSQISDFLVGMILRFFLSTMFFAHFKELSMPIFCGFLAHFWSRWDGEQVTFGIVNQLTSNFNYILVMKFMIAPICVDIRSTFRIIIGSYLT